MAQAVLLACTMNAVRSPMAAAMLRHLTRGSLYIESAGVRAGDLDPLAVEAMDEIGLAIGKHQPRCFEDLEDGSFDLVITLSPEAQHKAVELTRTAATHRGILAHYGPYGGGRLARAAPGLAYRACARPADGAPETAGFWPLQRGRYLRKTGLWKALICSPLSPYLPPLF